MSSMLRKKEVFTVITPIPGFIPRQLAIDILHSHSEVITLNPLVLHHKPIKAPRTAASDEYYSTWYEITQQIQYIPGLGRLGSGKISFNGCFHDMPWGLQTHIYAPMSVDLRNRYRIAGNQPGVEPPEQSEIGLSALGAPSDGLYLRDDVEIKCNVAVMSFVKSQLRAASKEMVGRIIKKAELLDAGVLHAMIEEDGKLKTINPNDRTSTPSEAAMSPRLSPTSLYHQPGAMSPPPVPYQVPRPGTYQQYNMPATPVQSPRWPAPLGEKTSLPPSASFAELPAPHVGNPRPQAHDSAVSMPVEMPGDFSYSQSSSHLQPPQPSPKFNSDRVSMMSDQSQPNNDWRWSQSQAPSQGGASQRTSYSSDASNSFHSPPLEQKGNWSGLPTHDETPEEHGVNADALRRLDPAPRSKHGSHNQKPYPYNPADYERMNGRPTHTASRNPSHSSQEHGR